MAATLDEIAVEIAEIQRRAREHGQRERPRWPMIVLRTPKGWTGPKVVDGLPAEGSFRSHQVPLTDLAKNPDHLVQLEQPEVFNALVLDFLRRNPDGAEPSRRRVEAKGVNALAVRLRGVRPDVSQVLAFSRAVLRRWRRSQQQ